MLCWYKISMSFCRETFFFLFACFYLISQKKKTHSKYVTFKLMFPPFSSFLSFANILQKRRLKNSRIASSTGACVSNVQSVLQGCGVRRWRTQVEKKNRHWNCSNNAFGLLLLFREASSASPQTSPALGYLLVQNSCSGLVLAGV